MNIYTQLLEVQKEIGTIKREATNPFYNSKYFDINTLLSVVKPILNKHNIVLTQGLITIGGKLGLRTEFKIGISVDEITNRSSTTTKHINKKSVASDTDVCTTWTPYISDIDSTHEDATGLKFDCVIPEIWFETVNEKTKTTTKGIDAQKMGSAITYFRRYALQSALALEAEDDDGNASSNKVIRKDKGRQQDLEEGVPF